MYRISYRMSTESTDVEYTGYIDNFIMFDIRTMTYYDAISYKDVSWEPRFCPLAT